tara:strand:+ start:464 stop:640 length:177 start_codon:yes stop_codon:yes gene_type:complete
VKDNELDTNEEELNSFEDIFDAYDYGEETYRIINGKECVYFTEGLWISKDGVELSERD